MTDKLVCDLMTETVQSVAPDRNLHHLANLFDRCDVGHVPMVDAEGDLVELIMTVEPVTVEANDAARQAARLLLEDKFAHIPVTEARTRLVGIVTQSEFLQLFGDGEE